MSKMTSGCPAWEFAADSHFLKLQHLKYVFETTGNLSRQTPTRDLYAAFKIPYIHNFVIKLCRQQSEGAQFHENVNVCNMVQREAQHRKYKRLRLGGQAYDRSSV